MNFIALDIETANADLSSICSIGLVHFKDGEPSKALRFLIDPEDEFDAMNISIHGISQEDVEGQPTLREVSLSEIKSEHIDGAIRRELALEE